ncbi:MAG: preprotein translocase subunit SecG [Moraxellaceae bacterium]|jgi:preprotein translocase subunit SecG|nr:preprotein translocase subunit SecG [Moraxellaceae bacterium]
MESFVLVVHVLVAVAMTGLILLQQGKGAEMGASFGAGASQTVFGAAGSVGFLTKMTGVLAAIFFMTSMGLAIYARQSVEGVLPVLPAAALEQVGDLPTAPATAPAPTGDDVPAVPAK